MTEKDVRADVEAPIRAALDASLPNLAAERIIELYGPEIIAFLGSFLRSPDEASDVFQIFCEQMWVSLPGFRGDSSVRTWAYAIARHAAFRQIRSPHRQPGRAVPLSSAPEVAAIADRVRTSTLRYLRTEVKERVAVLRESLEPDERALFVLRLNRKMPWLEIARVMEGTELSDAELDSRAALLRKRFQRAKERLRTLVAEDEARHTEA